jgi:hypothetical protein
VEKFPFNDFWDLAELLHDSSMGLYMSGPEDPLSQEDITETALRLRALLSHANKLELPVSVATLKSGIEDPPTTMADFDRIVGVVKTELSTRVFVFLGPDRAPYFEQSVSWIASFPNAASDIRQAKNCYACSLDTAAVFHAMRALEYALRALALDTGTITSGPIDTLTWASIIDQIAKEIEAKRKAAGGATNPKIEIWAGAAAQFFLFKEAWRNQTMHVRAVYNQTEARKIVEAVEDFIDKLAKGGLKE